MNSWICFKRCYNNYFSEIFVKIKWLDRETPACYSIPKFMGLNMCQSKWKYIKPSYFQYEHLFDTGAMALFNYHCFSSTYFYNQVWQLFVIIDFIERTLPSNLFTCSIQNFNCGDYQIYRWTWCLNYRYPMNTILLLLSKIMSVKIIC